jgi:hypothetical protein
MEQFLKLLRDGICDAFENGIREVPHSARGAWKNSHLYWKISKQGVKRVA